MDFDDMSDTSTDKRSSSYADQSSNESINKTDAIPHYSIMGSPESTLRSRRLSESPTALQKHAAPYAAAQAAQYADGHISITKAAEFTQSPEPEVDVQRKGIVLDSIDVDDSVSIDSASTSSVRATSDTIYRNVVDLHQTLYAGGVCRQPRSIIEATVEDLYAQNAVVETPLMRVQGIQSINDHFLVLSRLPGSLWSELVEICDATQFDGRFVCIMTHVLRVCLFPYYSTALHPSHQSYTSLANQSSVSEQKPGSLFGLWKSASDSGAPSTFSHLRREVGASLAAWETFKARLNPRALLSAATSVDVKVHTHLVFDEYGRIVYHEDTYGVKELIEGIFPILSPLYVIARNLGGVISTFAAHLIVARLNEPPHKD